MSLLTCTLPTHKNGGGINCKEKEVCSLHLASHNWISSPNLSKENCWIWDDQMK